MAREVDTVLGKVMTILEAFSATETQVSLAELARRTELPKTTVHRVAGDMTRHRLLERTPGGYRLSGGLFELGMRAGAERGLLELAMPFLQDLYERSHEVVHLGVLDGQEVVYVAKIGGHRQARSPSRTGGRMPLHCTAIGKALLAYGDAELRRSVLESPLSRWTPRTVVAPGLLAGQLAAVVETGVAFEREESTTGLLCVASAVLDLDGRGAVAAISVTGPVGRFKPEAHVSSVKAAASGLGSVLARRAGEAVRGRP